MKRSLKKREGTSKFLVSTVLADIEMEMKVNNLLSEWAIIMGGKGWLWREILLFLPNLIYWKGL